MSARTVAIKACVAAVAVLAALEASLNLVSYVYSVKNARVPRQAASVILCLGDSFTHGWGAEPRHSYPAVLQKLLDLNCGPGKFEVVNLGQEGMTSSLIANSFDSLLQKYHPDVVIVLCGANDHWNVYGTNVSKLMAGGRKRGASSRAVEMLYRSKTFRVMQTAAAMLIPGAKRGAGPVMGFSNIDDPGVLKDLVRYNHQVMAARANLPGEKVRVVVQTYATGCGVVNQVLREADLGDRVSLCDQELLFRGEPVRDMVSDDGWHPNAGGYNKMALNLYLHLVNKGILPPSPSGPVKTVESEPVKDDADSVVFEKDCWRFDLQRLAAHKEKGLLYFPELGLHVFANTVIRLPGIELPAGAYILRIEASGTPADDVFPAVRVSCLQQGPGLGEEALGNVFVNAVPAVYRFGPVTVGAARKVYFRIRYENDGCTTVMGKTADRNLAIRALSLTPENYSGQ